MKLTVGIVDYGTGNIASLEMALADLEVRSLSVSMPCDFQSVDAVILLVLAIWPSILGLRNFRNAKGAVEADRARLACPWNLSRFSNAHWFERGGTWRGRFERAAGICPAPPTHQYPDPQSASSGVEQPYVFC